METLDRFDLAILNELQNDGRMSNAELANRVGLSAAPCWRRVKALEESGFITGYRAEINRHKMGLGVLAFVRLDANRNSGDVLHELEEAIRQIPEVISCHYISGTGTFELQVVSRDLNSFSQFAREVLINLPNVKDLHTSFSLGEVKASSALPLGHLQPPAHYRNTKPEPPMNRRHTLICTLFWPLALMEYAQAAPDLIAIQAPLPMRNLLIEVRQVQSDDSQRTGVELGNRGGVQMNQSRNSGTATQQALVLNGRPVRLGLQTTTPIRLLQGFVRNGRVVTTVGTVLLEAGTGFSATPRWDGGTLIELELAAQQALRSGNAVPGAQANAGTNSVLALPLDEWTTVGESEQSSQSSNSGLTGAQQQSGQTRTEVQVRVTLR